MNLMWSELASSETEMVAMACVCLPFVPDARGQTLSAKVMDGQFVLESGVVEPPEEG